MPSAGGGGSPDSAAGAGGEGTGDRPAPPPWPVTDRPGHALRAKAAQAKRTSRQRHAEAKAARSRATELTQRAHDLAADRPGQPPDRHDEYVLILDEDPELANGLSDEDLAAARRCSRAPLLRISTPRWEPPEFDAATTYGLLVLDGLLGRRVRIESAVATELLGCGDILRPWDQATNDERIPAEFDWRVLDPARVAVLDARITRLIGARPQLTVNFAQRLFRRARNSSYLTAVAHLPRVEDRLLAMLWHLAINWGRVTPEGVRIPFRLSHQVLAEIIGSARPSVTLGLRHLHDQGDVMRAPDGTYVLLSEPDGRRPRRRHTPRALEHDGTGPSTASPDGTAPPR